MMLESEICLFIIKNIFEGVGTEEEYYKPLVNVVYGMKDEVI